VRDSWPGIAVGSVGLALDAVQVVWLRSLRLAAGGDPARRELALMVEEKWRGHAAFALALASGRIERSPKGFAAATVAHYGPLVRKNRRRLSRRA
jgi:hypothetical protein